MNLNDLNDPINDPWRSHLDALKLALADSEGPVLEVGCGYFSTPFLYEYCQQHKRTFVSIETDPSWVIAMNNHLNAAVVTCRPNYDRIEYYALQRWGVVFLDHSPGERRGEDAVWFAQAAKYVVVHDWSADEIKVGFTTGRLALWAFELVYAQKSPSTLVLCRDNPFPLTHDDRRVWEMDGKLLEPKP